MHVLFQDNQLFSVNSATCHVAAVCIKWFQDNHTLQLEWPENSSDLNSIEIVKGQLKKTCLSEINPAIKPN